MSLPPLVSSLESSHLKLHIPPLTQHHAAVKQFNYSKLHNELPHEISQSRSSSKIVRAAPKRPPEPRLGGDGILIDLGPGTGQGPGFGTPPLQLGEQSLHRTLSPAMSILDEPIDGEIIIYLEYGTARTVPLVTELNSWSTLAYCLVFKFKACSLVKLGILGFELMYK